MSDVKGGNPEHGAGSCLHILVIIADFDERNCGVIMNKPKSLYLVKHSSGRMLHVWAVSSNQAKRIFCKEYGIRPGDDWCGLSALSAHRLKPEEVKAWEMQMEAERTTLAFIRGMLEISVKVHAERRNKL